MRFLEAEFDRRPMSSSNSGSGIELSVAANQRAEVEGIAREIRRLIKEKGYRYRDIAVLIRNGQDYQDTLETVFHDYEIPYFNDQNLPMLNHPLIELIRSTLEIISSNWSYEPISDRLKQTCFSRQAVNSAAARANGSLENYVLAHGVRGRKWTEKTPWKYRRFRGLELVSSPQTDAEREIEKTINESRNIVTSPLMRLDTRLKKAKQVKNFAKLYIYFWKSWTYPGN